MSAVYIVTMMAQGPVDIRGRIIILIARRGVGYEHIHGEMRPCNDR